MELDARKGQRALLDGSCTKRKRSEMDVHPRELWIRLNADIACGVEGHEKQQLLQPGPPPRHVGRPRNLPAVETGTRDNASGPSNGGRGRGRGRGEGRGPTGHTYGSEVPQRWNLIQSQHYQARATT